MQEIIDIISISLGFKAKLILLSATGFRLIKNEKAFKIVNN
jgi:hypothetical protein